MVGSCVQLNKVKKYEKSFSCPGNPYCVSGGAEKNGNFKVIRIICFEYSQIISQDAWLIAKQMNSIRPQTSEKMFTNPLPQISHT